MRGSTGLNPVAGSLGSSTVKPPGGRPRVDPSVNPPVEPGDGGEVGVVGRVAVKHRLLIGLIKLTDQLLLFLAGQPSSRPRLAAGLAGWLGVVPTGKFSKLRPV